MFIGDATGLAQGQCFRHSTTVRVVIVRTFSRNRIVRVVVVRCCPTEDRFPYIGGPLTSIRGCAVGVGAGQDLLRGDGQVEESVWGGAMRSQIHRMNSPSSIYQCLAFSFIWRAGVPVKDRQTFTQSMWWEFWRRRPNNGRISEGFDRNFALCERRNIKQNTFSFVPSRDHWNAQYPAGLVCDVVQNSKAPIRVHNFNRIQYIILII